jgi:glycosyltransferase involved in cell wall biosynthesis
VYLAVHESFKPIKIDDTHQEILRKYGIRTKYILSVNTIEPRKNIFNLIVAFSEYLQNSKRNDLSLVIVGKKAWDYQRCYEKVKELYLEQNVIFCGYVAQEDLPIIYNGAEAFIYPSFYEGFGFPVLEAMSCGTPVLCSQTSSLPEVCGDAALFIDPYDMRNMSFSIRKVLKDKTL